MHVFLHDNSKVGCSYAVYYSQTWVSILKMQDRLGVLGFGFWVYVVTVKNTKKSLGFQLTPGFFRTPATVHFHMVM